MTDRAAVTKRTSLLQGFIVERDFVDMYIQSEVLKELGVLIVKVAELNTWIFGRLDPSMGKMTPSQFHPTLPVTIVLLRGLCPSQVRSPDCKRSLFALTRPLRDR